ncbi:hypothetical protein A1O1_05444 [Capronia coronata CBS 617.96]|uniref:Flavin reductase like domain-containing protein n=1 Tax=Capronia coronata CBS 617.96 TaxID=1182541 RepID=W9Z1Y0_9EURO|nr:uncharacterized protein A1O1_05444 [Capronia coronata CBS 617.96]EXJ88514.1 hypothetical protein A1O1_05444 [Capronia coronata CBS 617.96]
MFSADQKLLVPKPNANSNPNTDTDLDMDMDSRKDSVRNAEATGVFCWQLATYPLRHAVSVTAQPVPYGVDEFERAGLTKTYSKVLKTQVPMVAESPVRFECEYHSTLKLPGNPPTGSVDVVIGKVVGIHVDESVLTDGKIDVSKTQPIARCGYYEYAVVRDTFDMIVPRVTTTLFGLAGDVKMHSKHRDPVEKTTDVDEPTSS